MNCMDIRNLPEQQERVETGPIQFGEDHPGLFVRGDQAGYYAMVLKQLVESLNQSETELDPIAMVQIDELQKLFASPIVGPARTLVSR